MRWPNLTCTNGVIFEYNQVIAVKKEEYCIGQVHSDLMHILTVLLSKRFYPQRCMECVCVAKKNL